MLARHEYTLILRWSLPKPEVRLSVPQKDHVTKKASPQEIRCSEAIKPAGTEMAQSGSLSSLFSDSRFLQP